MKFRMPLHVGTKVAKGAGYTLFGIILIGVFGFIGAPEIRTSYQDEYGEWQSAGAPWIRYLLFGPIENIPNRPLRNPQEMDLLLDTEIYVAELERRDCFNILDWTGDQVVLRECSNAEYQISAKFLIPDNGNFPGAEYMQERGDLVCPDNEINVAIGFLAATPLSWSLGDRAIVCLSEPTDWQWIDGEWHRP